LSDRDRLMLQMFHDRQMNYRAMAAELGISAYKVKSRLFSARQRFRNLYAAGS
jgi:DNA-directed RNA polymerase specialized sigma24 family protein